MNILLITICLVIMVSIMAMSLAKTTNHYISFVVTIFTICLLGVAIQPKQQTYYISSDMPEWEKHEAHASGTFVDTLYFNNKKDTVYATATYINIKL